jgi:hypothetical protein
MPEQVRLPRLQQEDPAAWRLAVYGLDEATWQHYDGDLHGIEYVRIAREYEAAFRQVYGLDKEAFRHALTAVINPQDNPETWRHILTTLLHATAPQRTWRLFSDTIRHISASP